MLPFLKRKQIGSVLYAKHKGKVPYELQTSSLNDEEDESDDDEPLNLNSDIKKFIQTKIMSAMKDVFENLSQNIEKEMKL